MRNGYARHQFSFYNIRYAIININENFNKIQELKHTVKRRNGSSIKDPKPSCEILNSPLNPPVPSLLYSLRTPP